MTPVFAEAAGTQRQADRVVITQAGFMAANRAS